MAKAERPYYGFRPGIYILLALLGGGIAVTALAIAFSALAYSTWQLALCWFFGLLLLIIAAFWHTMVVVAYPWNIKALEDNLLKLLRESDWDGTGKVIDIGTGGGRLAVPIAREFPRARVTGVDIWPKSWTAMGTDRARAEENARIAKVEDRCIFQYGDALELPFKDGEFSIVVSGFTFHGINVPDRTVLLQEALRILAPGGTFLICDLFPRGYGVRDAAGLVAKTRELGTEDVSHRSLEEAGVNLGRLARIWGMSYLGGKKMPVPA